MVRNIAVQLLKEMKADNRLYLNCKALCLVMKQLLHKCTEYLANQMLLSNTLLKNVICISLLCRKEPESILMLHVVVGQLPYCATSSPALIQSVLNSKIPGSKHSWGSIHWWQRPEQRRHRQWLREILEHWWILAQRNAVNWFTRRTEISLTGSCSENDP